MLKKNGLNSSQNLSKTRKSCFKKIVQHTFVCGPVFIFFKKKTRNLLCYEFLAKLCCYYYLRMKSEGRKLNFKLVCIPKKS